MSAGQEIIYPVGGRWVGAFSRWVGGLQERFITDTLCMYGKTFITE